MRQFRLLQVPGTFPVERRNEIAYASLKMHRVATQAIVHLHLFLVLRDIQKNVVIGSAVPARAPGCELLLMTALAAQGHGQDVVVSQPRLFRYMTAKVREHATHIVQVKIGVEGKHVAVAVGAWYVAMRRRMPVGVRLPDLVTAGASASGALVIDAGCSNRQ